MISITQGTELGNIMSQSCQEKTGFDILETSKKNEIVSLFS